MFEVVFLWTFWLVGLILLFTVMWIQCHMKGLGPVRYFSLHKSV